MRRKADEHSSALLLVNTQALACGGPVAAAGVCGALSSRAIKTW